ncbi:hypothetical protein FisN_14Hh155 [Fistulifera solaris]|uniref:Myosin motor domain-containing protein n=1 Tax=Fistulifera solaris TaxID=1519565 RepID=A0A1Z5K8P9_FISSO|nr:hypothetical protein FisN_14Hh155 [Fistulifera solaris]|eukprot:GAX22532.1 hypothetical protein FisN_14Hh155 [Fistulifera solaris]
MDEENDLLNESYESMTQVDPLSLLLSVKTSNHVYVKSDEYAWVPARLLESDGEKATVSIPHYRDEQAIQSDGGRGSKTSSKVVVELKDYPTRALYLQNVDEEGNLREVEDMVDLPFLHEAAILYNLKFRHKQGKPYTRTGDIVIACNPYQWYNHLYTDQVRHQYAETLVWSIPDGSCDPRSTITPHVYEASALAYRGLSVEGDDQSILVSGESGAGKTETVKILLSHLASVQRGRSAKPLPDVPHQKQHDPIVQRVLDSNPLLEAFGNAKTVRNDNSSRFGKYLQLQFDAEDPAAAAFAGKTAPSCVLAGSKCEVYLLEKSRVCLHEEDTERTYHIFYQLLAAPEEQKVKFWKGLEDTDHESFCYVGHTDTHEIEGKSDAERFQYTVDSLALVGIEGETLRNLMRVICIVLQLGNLIFDPDETDDGKTVISDEADLLALAELMGVTSTDLQSALTIRTIIARNEEFKVPLNSTAAKESCDAYAKEIYAKTFLWLVRTVNDATCAEMNYEGGRKSGFGLIGLLDIFGFESFETNRFEQLCINYANEKLQQKFTQDIFRSVQQEYEFEGIELGEITYDDNTDVLDLVEGRMGLLAFLNEECLRPGGNDKGFVSKVQAMNKDNPCFIRENHFHDCEFGIHHYAGRVIYDADAFVTKNTDTLCKDLQEISAKSTNPIIAKELVNDSMVNTATSSGASGASKAKKKAPARAANQQKSSKPGMTASNRQNSSSIAQDTVWTKFKSQLTSLMSSLKLTRTRYIRCIKPNTLKEPLVMQHQSTVEQLRCAGVVAAVTISRSAFPNRLEHEVVTDRFKSAWKPGQLIKAEESAAENLEERPRILAQALLTSALKPLAYLNETGHTVQAFVLGRSRTYFRAGALEFLESERLKRLATWATLIQRCARRFTARSLYLKQRSLAIKIASYTRMRSKRRAYQHLRKVSIMLQCWYRCIWAASVLDRLNRDHKATLIQTHWRMSMAVDSLRQSRKATIQIQRIMRGAIQRPKFRAALHERREEAKLENQLRALQRKLEEAEQARVEAERKAEERARARIEAEAKAAEEAKLKAAEEAEEKKNDPVDDDESAVHSAVSRLSSDGVSELHVDESPESQTRSLSAQQQTLMDESGRMLEYLRKEVFKYRTQNAQMRADFDVLKENNQRLMDANASAGASFSALNQHTKQLSKANEKLTAELAAYKKQAQKLGVIQVELKEELKMKQATYVAEVHSRLQYQKALQKIVDLVEQRCRDPRLAEDILRVADTCDSEFSQGTTTVASPKDTLSTPSPGGTSDSASRRDSFLMTSIRSLWS